MDTKENLRHAYRKTWEAFSRQMKTVHELAGVGEAATVDGARREADLAMAAHQDARNKLAELLAPEKVLTRRTAGVWPCGDGRQICNNAIGR